MTPEKMAMLPETLTFGGVKFAREGDTAAYVWRGLRLEVEHVGEDARDPGNAVLAATLRVSTVIGPKSWTDPLGSVRVLLSTRPPKDSAQGSFGSLRFAAAHLQQTAEALYMWAGIALESEGATK